jgi:biotin carboxyl carrier protein
MLDEKLRQLVEFAKTTDLTEVKWEKGGNKISFRRTNVKPLTPAGEVIEEVQPEAPAEPETLYIRSTMVGTFYRADSADRPPLVVEGTQVVNGQPVASIEAMKIRKDVVAPMGCRIVKALVADGHSVEYGQPLFEIEKTNGANGNV